MTNKTIKIRILHCVLGSIILSSCSTIDKSSEIEEQPTTQSITKIEPQFSSEPIIQASTNDVLFAQSALKKLTYSIGYIDGIWGKRSAAALQDFESKHGLKSANGSLSELNLHKLEIISGIKKQNFKITPQRQAAKNIQQLLNKEVPLSNSAQLIILEKSYQVFSKPNPFSAELLTLSPGSGVYIINHQDGWYQIETLDQQTGFVKSH